MDTIFSLAAVPRARVLERAAAHVPGCLYLCLWAPVTAQPSSRFARPSLSRLFRFPFALTEQRIVSTGSHLFCLDAWIGGGGGDRARATFEAYRGALCAVVSGYAM
jgi:hypothetical protein